MKWIYGTSLPFMLGPILHEFYNHYGLEVSFFYQILAVSVVSTFVFEVPTGMIADRIGYKYSLFLGVLMMTISVFMMVFLQSFFWFVFSEILFALGIAFKSGADAGLIYDSLVILKKEDEYVDIFSKIRKYTYLFAGVGSVLSSVIFKLDPRLPFLINSLFMATNILLTLFLTEPNHTKDENRITFKEQMNFVVKHSLKNRDILRIVLVSSVLYGFFRMNFNSYQPFLKAQGVDVLFYGVIFFSLNLVAYIASSNSKKVLSLFKSNFIFLLVVIVMSFTLLSIPVLPAGILGMMVAQFFRSLYPPITTEMINKRTESSIRATMLSTLSFAGNLMAAVFAFVIGLYANHVSTYQNNIIIALTLVVIYLVLNQVRKRKNS